MKKILVSRSGESLNYIISEDGQPVCRGVYSTVSANTGDILEGVVTASKREVNGCFADVGGSRTAFFDVEKADYRPGDRRGFYLQAMPTETKGALINVKLPFTGIYNALVLIPLSPRDVSAPPPFIKISRRIGNAEIANELLSGASEIVGGLNIKGYSISLTVRTAAADDQLCAMRELSSMTETIKSLKLPPDRGSPGKILYKRSFPEFIIENYRRNDYGSVVTNDPGAARDFKAYFEERGLPLEAVLLPPERDPFDTDPSAAVAALYSHRTVNIPGGGTVIYDKTEAMHVFDVNSGGSRSSPLSVNLAACECISRYLSVNNLTGIVVIDFISMKKAADREQVEKRMHALLQNDYALNIVYGFTQLQLLEISRSRKLL